MRELKHCESPVRKEAQKMALRENGKVRVKGLGFKG